MKKRGVKFWQWTIREVEHQFQTDRILGLSDEAAVTNREKYGSNIILSGKKNSAFLILLHQFSNFFIILLLIAAIISFFVDGMNQSLLLLTIVLVNVFLGFFQEYKADRAISELKRTFQSETRVIRNGGVRTIPSAELVSGDVVLLEQGDKVPSDIRVSQSVSMQTNEASLTGESEPISKHSKTIQKDVSLGDRKNILFAGTLVISGRGRGIVVNVGRDTEFGQIAKLVSKGDDKTPLEKQINYLAKNLTIVALFVCALVFGLGYFRDYPLWPLLTLTIALLVAVVPESLPTVVTLALSSGVMKMAKQQAVVRRLASVETLGTTNIIATDKTGTLTNNILEIGQISLINGEKFQRLKMTERISDPRGLKLLIDGLVCSNIENYNTDEFIGDPVEVAIARKADSLRLDLTKILAKYKRLMEIPFDSVKKYMAVLVETESKRELVVKGAPEVVIENSNLTKKFKDLATEEADNLGSMGYKVVAIGKKILAKGQEAYVSKLDFVGFLAMADEPAEGVANSIKETIASGIRVIMITGDHKETAKSIANQIGMKVIDDEIISGEEMELLPEKQLIEKLKITKVFARVTPKQKYELIKILISQNYSVAVTGDGVNDAPALKEATVGIAMGKRGNEVARDAADIVLLDDSYKTIVTAIRYGRTIFDNIKNAFVYLISGNLKEVLLVSVSFALGLPAALTALQILWINLITDALPALSLGLESPNEKRPLDRPRQIGSAALRQPIVYAMSLAILTSASAILVYFWALKNSKDEAQTMVFSFVVAIDLLIVLSIRSKKRIWQSLSSFFENKLLVFSIVISSSAQLLIFQTDLSKYFGITKLGITQIVLLLCAALLTFLVAELLRGIVDSYFKKVAVENPVALATPKG